MQQYNSHLPFIQAKRFLLLKYIFRITVNCTSMDVVLLFTTEREREREIERERERKKERKKEQTYD